MGDALREASSWQPVDALPDVDFCALLNKPTILTSNAFLLRTRTQLVIVDPGADPAQVARINELVDATLREAPRQVTLLLTHAHLDHFGAADALRPSPGRTIVHAIGATAIRSKDREQTLAVFYPRAPFPDLDVDVELYGADPAPGLRYEERAGPDGGLLTVGFLSLEPGLELEIYPTPGHSPCSCSFRIGSQMLIGDVTFGASPGLIGLLGWDRNALVQSTRLLRDLIESGGVATCWTGHGGALAGPIALRALRDTERQLELLHDIAPMDEDRATLLRQFAVELLHEIEQLFMLIAARVLVVAHHLEQLEELAEAERLERLIDFDPVERSIADFQKFCRSFEAGEQPELAVAMKAAAALERIRRALPKDVDARTGPASLAARAQDLIDAFLQMVRGLTFRGSPERIDLPHLVEALVRREASHPHDAEAFFAAAEDDETFRRLLVENLSSSAVLRGRSIVVRRDRAADWDGMAVTDPTRFQNVLLSTLESLVAGSAHKEIELVAGLEAGVPTLAIMHPSARSIVPAIREQLYRRAMQQMGGDFQIGDDAVRIQLAPARVGDVPD